MAITYDNEGGSSHTDPPKRWIGNGIQGYDLSADLCNGCPSRADTSLHNLKCTSKHLDYNQIAGRSSHFCWGMPSGT